MKSGKFKLKIPKLVLFDETGLSGHTIRTMKLVIWSVAFGTICFNITGGIAMTGYLKELGVTDFIYGLLLSIGRISGVVQIFASYILELTRKRKGMFMIFGLIQRTAWLPFGLVPFYIPMSAPTMRIWFVTMFLFITAMCDPFMNVTFFSFFADVIPIRIRGSYLCVRQRVSTVFGIAGGLLMSLILDRVPGFNGYALVFALAAVCGTTDIATFFFVKFPPMPERTRRESIIRMLSQVLKDKHFIAVAMFVTIWSFSINIAQPFAYVYERLDLGLSNTLITATMQILPNVCSVVVLNKWGRALDRRGAKKVMMKSGRFVSLFTILWVFVTPGNIVMGVILIIIMSTAGGLMTSGIDMGSQNAYLNRAPEKNRSMYVAVYLCLTTLVGVGVAYAAGGWLMDNVFSRVEAASFSLFGIYFTRYNYAFLLSWILRVISAFVLLPRMVSDDKPVMAA